MDTIYAWAAGFIDGEGTITLKRTKAPSSATKIHYQPYVALGQANHVGHYEAVNDEEVELGMDRNHRLSCQCKIIKGIVWGFDL